MINWINQIEWKIAIGIIVSLIIIFIIIKIVTSRNIKEKLIKRNIRESRKELRNLHDKYQKELFNITMKIDKFLETIEQ